MWPGELPGSLPDDLPLCFAHVDLDHYEPTIQTLEWCWENLPPGGTLAFHDYPVNYEPSGNSPLAIKDFLKERSLELSGFKGHSGWVIKEESYCPLETEQ